MSEESEEKKPLVYYSRIRGLLKGIYNGEETKLNVSGDAKDPMLAWFEALIAEAAECIVEAMPVKSKGEQEGQLSRKTVKKGDVTKGKRVFRDRYKETKKKGKK